MDVSTSDPLLVARDTVTVTWNPQAILPDALNVPLVVNVSMYQVSTFPNQITLVRNAANTGSASITVPPLTVGDLFPVVLRVTTDLYQQTAGIWGSVLIFTNTRDLRSTCDAWSDGQLPNIRQVLVERLPACPPTVSRARRDSRFTADTGVRARVNEIYRSTAAVCYRQTTFTRYLHYVRMIIIIIIIIMMIVHSYQLLVTCLYQLTAYNTFLGCAESSFNVTSRLLFMAHHCPYTLN